MCSIRYLYIACLLVYCIVLFSHVVWRDHERTVAAHSRKKDTGGAWFAVGKGKFLDLQISLEDGAAEILVGGSFWFHLRGGLRVLPGNSYNHGSDNWTLVSSTISSPKEHSLFGSYVAVTLTWALSHTSDYAMDTSKSIETSYWVFEKHSMIIFDQHFASGWTRGAKDPNATIVMGFPSVQVTSDDLGYLSWGECFLEDTRAGRWSDLMEDEDISHYFDGDIYGQPWMLHEYEQDAPPLTVMWSSLSNFMVSGFGLSRDENGVPSVDVGLRSTLQEIPPGFHHTSILVAGRGINGTMMEWGDILLKLGGKSRSKLYDDFTLSHLGYWTDNGAYHYRGVHPGQANMEEALLHVKEELLHHTNPKVPIRYVQWDDWWMESKGDIPGMLSWTPKPDVFPSGFSNWLDLPLSMYAPEYSANNVWKDSYQWLSVNTPRGPTAIPLDDRFYLDLFRNGTQIGMTMFEQDFLCSYGIGDSGLTSRDAYSGKQWLENLNAAALYYNVTLQLCMANAYHILQSTTMASVTNARATGDNTRDYRSVRSMGQNGLLFSALGLFASRDNVWTTSASIEQVGCGNSNFCYEPNAHLDNAVAVLSGGPYGIADAVQHVNASVVLRSCRTDGVLLRPQLPLAALDVSYYLKPSKDVKKNGMIWAAHDEVGGYRWSYIIGVELDSDFLLLPSHLTQGNSHLQNDDDMVAWEVDLNAPANTTLNIIRVSQSSPLNFHKSKPLDLPYDDIQASSHTHFAVAPVLSNGMVILGEVDKWATMSIRRVAWLESNETDVALEVVGAPSELVRLYYLTRYNGPEPVQHVDLIFPNSCSEKDRFGNVNCRSHIHCAPLAGCQTNHRIEASLTVD